MTALTGPQLAGCRLTAKRNLSYGSLSGSFELTSNHVFASEKSSQPSKRGIMKIRCRSCGHYEETSLGFFV